jgi:hypothetical protein
MMRLKKKKLRLMQRVLGYTRQALRRRIDAIHRHMICISQHLARYRRMKVSVFHMDRPNSVASCGRITLVFSPWTLRVKRMLS